MTRLADTIKRYDFISMACVFAFIYNRAYFLCTARQRLWTQALNTAVQFVAMVMGIVLIYLISLMDYDDILSFWKYITGACVFVLLLVLVIGQGKESTGTKGWIRFGGIGIQPAELVKIGFIITLSKHLEYVGDDINYIKNVLLLLAHLAVPVFLVMLQPDFGTAMVFIFIFVVMLL